MTAMWLPTLSHRPGPKYLRIADALAEDVYAGRLAVGDRLPTHRDLAWKLGVTVGTVSRAYSEAERRGLVVGEVGRGSFVRAGARSQATLAMPDDGGPQMIDLGMNRPPVRLAEPEFAAALTRLAQTPKLGSLLNYEAHTGRWSHRAAGAAWIGRRGLEVRTDTVLLTSGAEHAIAAALMALADPGDTVLVEELTWSGTRALASLLRLVLKPVPMDGEGVLPDAFEAACRTSGARLFYCMPTIHNPTTAVIPAARRQALAEIARAHDITIIEDDVYGFLAEGAPPPLAAYAPERTIYITAASKSVAPALRVGFAALPEDRIGRFSAAARATNWMAPALLAELFARWVEDGTADLIARRIRNESAARQRLAAELLAGCACAADPNGFHLWLHLPEPWRAQDFVTAARQRGVSLSATELFVPGRVPTPHAVRVALSAPEDRDVLARGLVLLAGLLRQPPDPCLAEA